MRQTEETHFQKDLAVQVQKRLLRWTFAFVVSCLGLILIARYRGTPATLEEARKAFENALILYGIVGVLILLYLIFVIRLAARWLLRSSASEGSGRD